MKRSKILVRMLLAFILLGGLVAGVFLSSMAAVQAAPQMQVTCGVNLAVWSFEQSPISTTAPSASISNVIASSNSGSGLQGQSFSPNGVNNSNSWTASGWPTTGSVDATDYFEFDIDTTSYTNIQMTFYASINGTGPQSVSIRYSSSGGGGPFTEFQTNSLQTNGSIAKFTVDFSSITQIENNPNTVIHIYGYNATDNSAGTLSIDDVTFTGCPPPTATPTNTDTPTLTDTPTITSTPTSTPSVTPRIIINEVGWSGTKCSANDQWVELYNPNSFPVNLSGWDLFGSNTYYDAGNFDILLSGTISAQGYFLIAATATTFKNVTINLHNTDLIISNHYQDLELYYSNTLVDWANIQGYYNWSAGTASPNYASMERYYPPGGPIPYDGPTAWVTFATAPYGSPIPLDNCNNQVRGTPGRANWALTVTETPSPLPTATRKPTPSPAPTPIPAVVINEILPRPASDWNGDGLINNSDEFIEVENLGPGVATLTNWKLNVLPNNGVGQFTIPSLKLNPNQRAVFFGSVTHLSLQDSGDTVRLIDTKNIVEDAYTYPAVSQPDDSRCRFRDGIGPWRDGCFPTPGLENALSGILPPAPPQPGLEAACQLPDVAPSEFKLAECNGFGAGIWNQQYWNDQSGQDEYVVSDPNSKDVTYIK